MMDWDALHQEARRAIDDVRREQPEVVALAELTSLAVRVDATFLREARLQLLPGAFAEVEADLWFSSLVESKSASGFVLLKEVRRLLQESLSSKPELLERAWTLRLRFHAFLTPEMRLEEEISRLALMGPVGIEQLNACVLRAVGAMSVGGARAMGVARWALNAIPRLPKLARETEAGVALAFGTAERLGYSSELFQGMEPASLSPPLLEAVRGDHQEWRTCRVGVTWNAKDLVLEEEPAIRQPGREILLPASSPRLLYVGWTGARPGHRLLAEKTMSRLVPLPEGVQALILRTIEGNGFVVTRQPTLASEESSAQGAMSVDPEQVPSFEDDWHERLVNPLLSSTMARDEDKVVWDHLQKEKQALVIVAPRGYGKSTLLRRIEERGRSRLSMVWLNMTGTLLQTQGCLNNLVQSLPFDVVVGRELSLRAVRESIVLGGVSDQWYVGDERVIEALAREAVPTLLDQWTPDTLEDLVRRVRRCLEVLYPETSARLQVDWLESFESDKPFVVFRTERAGKPVMTTLSRTLLQEFFSDLREPLMRALGIRADGTVGGFGYESHDPALYDELRGRAAALVETRGASGLARVLERDFLPYRENELFVVVIDGLNASSYGRYAEFIGILREWTRRDDARWSGFRLVLLATPGVPPVPDTRSVLLPGFDSSQIEKLAQSMSVVMSKRHTEYLRQLTGGGVELVGRALGAVRRHDKSGPQGMAPALELLWDEEFREDIEKLQRWLGLEGKRPIRDALGLIFSGFEVNVSEVAPLLDGGILERLANGYALRASMYAPVALGAREQVRPPGFRVDVLVNAAPGSLPAWYEPFMSLVCGHLEKALGRAPIVQVETLETEAQEQPEPWVILNLFTKGFRASAACWSRTLPIERRARDTGTPRALYVLLDAVPANHELSEHCILNLRENLFVWKTHPPGAGDDLLQVAALRAAHQLVYMMLHAPDSFSQEYAEVERLDAVRRAREDELVQLVYEGPEVGDAILKQVPGFMIMLEVNDDRLPGPSHEGSIIDLEEITFSLRRSSLAWRGGGSALMVADIQFEASLDFLMGKAEYFGLSEEEQSRFTHSDLTDDTVMVCASASMVAVAEVLIETEVSEAGVPNISTVVVMDVTDLRVLDIL